MNSLMPINKTTIGQSEVNTVSARELHEFLEVKSVFRDWIARRIGEYGFEEGKDYVKISNDDNHLNFRQAKSLEKITRKMEYHLSLDMAKELSMVERNEKGSQARKYFIECEKRLNGPTPNDLTIQAIEGILFNPDFIIGLATNYKDALVQIEVLSAENEKLEPKAKIHDVLMEADTALPMGEVARILHKDFDIGRSRLFAFLRDQGVLMKDNLPKQTYMNRGYFRVVEKTHELEGVTNIYRQTLVYQKGIAFIIRLLQQEKAY